MEKYNEERKASTSSWQSDDSRSSSSDSLLSIDKSRDAHLDRRSSNPIHSNYHRNSSLRATSFTPGAHSMIRRIFRRSLPTTPTPLGERMLQALKEQPSFWEAHAWHGTDYDISEGDLCKITDVDNRRMGASDLWQVTTVGHLGFQKTMEHLAGLQAQPRTAAQEAARLRLKGAWDHPPNETNPDLFIKIVHDLDIILFGGELNGRLLVTWEDKITPMLHPGTPPDKQPHPYFRHDHVRWRDPLRGWCNPAAFRLFGLQKAHITLNKDLYLQCEKRVLWGLVIFEMIMSYIDLGCGHFGNDEMAMGAEVDRVRERCVQMLELEGLDGTDVENGWMPVPVREERDDDII